MEAQKAKTDKAVLYVHRVVLSNTDPSPGGCWETSPRLCDRETELCLDNCPFCQTGATAITDMRYWATSRSPRTLFEY
ncbi:hypothetical protein PAMP_013482 [Pampus punctatissimus]